MIRTVQPVRNRHLVRELDRGRVRELLLVVALVALMLLPLLAYVWNHMEWIRVGYEMEQMKRERGTQAELRERLRIEKAVLQSLGRVERDARSALGLVPGEAAVVRLGGTAAPSLDIARNQGAPAAALPQAEGVPR